MERLRTERLSSRRRFMKLIICVAAQESHEFLGELKMIRRDGEWNERDAAYSPVHTKPLKSRGKNPAKCFAASNLWVSFGGPDGLRWVRKVFCVSRGCGSNIVKIKPLDVLIGGDPEIRKSLDSTVS